MNIIKEARGRKLVVTLTLAEFAWLVGTSRRALREVIRWSQMSGNDVGLGDLRLLGLPRKGSRRERRRA